MKSILALVLIGYAAAQLGERPPRGGQGRASQRGRAVEELDCPTELTKLNACLGQVSMAELDARKEARKAAKDLCFSTHCPAAQKKDRKKCMKEAMDASGLKGDLQTCVSGAGISNAEVFAVLAMGKGQKGKRGGQRGSEGRGGEAGGMAGRSRHTGGRLGFREGRGQGKGGRLLAACDKDERKVEALRGCLEETMAEDVAEEPSECLRSFPLECRQPVCQCFKPSLEAKREDLLRSLAQCNGDGPAEEEERSTWEHRGHLFDSLCQGKSKGKGKSGHRKSRGGNN